MKIKKGFVLRDICGEKVIIAEGLENIDFSKMISLNETAAFLWTASIDMDEIDENKLCDVLLSEYDVTREQAIADIRQTLDKWQEHGLVE